MKDIWKVDRQERWTMVEATCYKILTTQISMSVSLIKL